MTHQERDALYSIGYSRLGAGYDNDAYVLAGGLINAAANLKNQYGDYPSAIQDALHQFESYALVKEGDVSRECVEATEAFWRGESRFLSEFASVRKAYLIIYEFTLHRLAPEFQDERLNEEIRRAREKHEAAMRPKSFWKNLFG